MRQTILILLAATALGAGAAQQIRADVPNAALTSSSTGASVAPCAAAKACA